MNELATVGALFLVLSYAFEFVRMHWMSVVTGVIGVGLSVCGILEAFS